jgi:hypothetical protein
MRSILFLTITRCAAIPAPRPRLLSFFQTGALPCVLLAAALLLVIGSVARVGVTQVPHLDVWQKGYRQLGIFSVL